VKNERLTAYRFAFSPPVPCVSSASGFLLASALSLHEALRPPGAEDARCVEPTSATRTIDVYPSAVRSRLSRTTFAARDAPRQSVAVTLHDRGNERFHDARTASAPNTLRTRCPHAFRLTAFGHERRPVGPAAHAGTRPLTPLSRTPLPLRAHVTFVRGLESSRMPLWFRTMREGRKSEKPAETIIAASP